MTLWSKRALIQLALLCLAAVAPVLSQACPEPRPELLPTYSSGAAMVLAWPAVPAVAGYSLWAQWRVPEGEVIRTLELSASEPRVALPASPQPWHPLRSRK